MVPTVLRRVVMLKFRILVETENVTECRMSMRVIFISTEFR